MLDCRCMSHRVHTILSILAEDHAPAALRPSILLAIDWPTVAEEAPATGDDAHVAGYAARIINGDSGLPLQQSPTVAVMASLSARLATVAASLAATGDKAMAAHATALWGAASALVGMPSEVRSPAGWDGLINGIASLTHVLPFCSRADEMLSVVTRWHATVARMDALAIKAADVVPGAIASGPAEKATLIATALDRVAHWIQTARAQHAALCDLGWDGDANLQVWAAARKREHDKALADIHALRDILGEAEGTERDHLRAQVDRMIAAMREDAPAPVKTRPQPGDVVSWAEVEDGALYFSRDNQGAKFHAHSGGRWYWLYGADDSDLERLLRGVGCIGTTGYEGTLSTLVARDLGTNPEAWHKAMREWTASELTRPR